MSTSIFSHTGSNVARSQRGHHWRLLVLALVAVDAIALVVAFATAYWLRFEHGVTLRPEVVPITDHYIKLVIFAIPAWLIIFAMWRLYDREVLLGGTHEYMLIFNACTTGVIFILFLGFFEDYILISRAWVVLSWMFAILLVSLDRVVMRRIAYRLRVRGYFVVPAMIVGSNEEACLLAEQLQDSRYSGLTVVGLVTAEPGAGEGFSDYQPEGMPILGTMNDIAELVRKYDVEEVIVATTALHRSQLLELFNCITPLPDTELRLSSGLYEVLTTGMRVNTVGSVPLMSMNKVRLTRSEVMLKTILDCAVAGTLLLMVSPVMFVIAALIRLDSPGPPIYRRRVLGMGRKTYDAYKFRTMYIDGDEILEQNSEIKAELEANHKLKDDPRVTRVGRLLRATSLDELPQLLNILRGQMSLVGPRMITLAEENQYGPMRYNLLTVKPGLTGMWQVSGRSDLTYEERVRLDMYYIRNYSIWLDLQILFVQTIPAVLKQRGAY